MLRTLLRAMLVAALFATLVLPATPAVAVEPTTYSLSTSSEPFKRGDNWYNLSIFASHYGGAEGGDSMTVSITQVHNPAGAAHATRSASYSWFFNGDRFAPLAINNTATLKTSAEMGDYGNVAVTLKKNNGPTSVCGDGKLTRWTGPLSGTVTLNTGTPLFGTVRAVPATGTLLRNTGSNCWAPNQPSNTCPDPGLSVSGSRSGSTVTAGYSNVSASLPNDTGDLASIFVMASAPLPAAKTNADGQLGRMLSTTALRRDVAIASGLATATVKGDTGTWVSGNATFTANQAATQGEPYPCAGGRESVNTYRWGMMSGGLAGDMLLGSDVAVGQNMVSSASRTIVRAR